MARVGVAPCVDRTAASCPADGLGRFEHVGAAGQLHLDRRARRSPGGRNARVIQPPLKRPLMTRLVPLAASDRAEPLAQRGAAARAAVGADVEVRQLALEQARDARADRMGVVEHDARDARRAAARSRPQRLRDRARNSARGARRSRPRRAPRPRDRAARRRRSSSGRARSSPGRDRARRRTGSRFTSMTVRESAVRTIVAPSAPAKS